MRVVVALLLPTLLAACATPAPRDAVALEVVVVRHAEKLADGGKDPALSEAGRARAQRLAGLLHDAPLVAVYSTDTRRTRETAQPTALAHGLTVKRYDAGISAFDFVSQILIANPRGAILVVGHSNTAPEIASMLCTCEVATMDEDEYDRVMRVRFDANGDATLQLEHD